MPVIGNWTPSSESSWDSLSGSCIWILFQNMPRLLPPHENLHGLDWKLGGIISRYLAEGNTVSTYIATQGRIPIPLLAINIFATQDSEIFFENARTMNFEKVIVLTENEGIMEGLKSLVKEKASFVKEWIFVSAPKGGE